MNFELTSMLYHTKNINDLYNKMSIKAAKECGLTKPEADILIFLKNNPTCDTARDIVKLKGFSKAYVSKAVELLVNKELITIETDKNDRRYQHIKVKTKAEPLINILRKMQLEFVDSITKGIKKEDIQGYIDVIEGLSKNALEQYKKM